VPTTSWGQKSAEDPAPPFSVGGVTAQVSKDTWFKFYGFIQTRYVFGRHRNDSGQLASGGGFSVPRVRLFYYGRLTDWLRVLVRVGASSDGSVSFEQAFADFQLKMLSFRVGQFNLPLFQEQTPSPVNIQGLNYAAVGSVFDGGQTQGLRITWAKDKSTVNLFITDGMRAGFAEVASPQVADIALSSRVQTRFGPGSAAQFDTGSSFRGDKLAVLLGTTVHYQSGGSLQDNAAQLGLISGDVTFERNGVSFSTSAAVMNTEASDGSRVYNVGTVIRAGAFVLPWTELFARYEGLVATKSETNPQTLFRGATGGINQYIWPARGIRVVADFVYYFDPTVGSPVQPDPNAGLFESSGPQWTARFQFNVLF
jgi:hypothetical protein